MSPAFVFVTNYFINEIDNVFLCKIASSKHLGSWENTCVVLGNATRVLPTSRVFRWGCITRNCVAYSGHTSFWGDLNIVCFSGIWAPVLCVLLGLRWVEFWIGGAAVGTLWGVCLAFSFLDGTLWLRRGSCPWFCTLTWLVAVRIVCRVVYILY